MDVGPDNIVLRFLRRIDERMDRLENDMRDVKLHLLSLEKEAAHTKSELATIRTDMVVIYHRIDRLEIRLDRIERRLDLTSA